MKKGLEKMRNNMSRLYGFGHVMSDSILTHMGYKTNIKEKHVFVNSTKWTYFRDLLSEVENNLGNSLRKKKRDNIKVHFSRKDYIAFCFKNGFPTRGQRRRTNSRTAKKMHKY